MVGDELVRGPRLRELRLARRWTQQQIVDALKEQEGGAVISLRGYQVWEASTQKEPKGIHWDNVVALGKLLEIEPELLL